MCVAKVELGKKQVELDDRGKGESDSLAQIQKDCFWMSAQTGCRGSHWQLKKWLLLDSIFLKVRGGRICTRVGNSTRGIVSYYRCVICVLSSSSLKERETG